MLFRMNILRCFVLLDITCSLVVAAVAAAAVVVLLLLLLLLPLLPPLAVLHTCVSRQSLCHI
jgi:hypothetical protein